jgi:hypothetical protein
MLRWDERRVAGTIVISADETDVRSATDERTATMHVL